MNNLELLQLMSDSANDAVLATKEQFNVDLDYSIESVALVDTTINNYLDTFKAQALEDKSVFTICNIYGAYVGEVFRKTVGGNWIFDDHQKDAPSVFISINENQYAFAGICYEKLVNDSKVSVKKYFDLAVTAHSVPKQ
ncbi:MAG: hypothetical protein ACJAVV_002689 [Alphaproteobacteria bacterium]|jgi:hypothetical protein